MRLLTLICNFPLTPHRIIFEGKCTLTSSAQLALLFCCVINVAGLLHNNDQLLKLGMRYHIPFAHITLHPTIFLENERDNKIISIRYLLQHQVIPIDTAKEWMFRNFFGIVRSPTQSLVRIFPEQTCQQIPCQS